MTIRSSFKTDQCKVNWFIGNLKLCLKYNVILNVKVCRDEESSKWITSRRATSGQGVKELVGEVGNLVASRLKEQDLLRVPRKPYLYLSSCWLWSSQFNCRQWRERRGETSGVPAYECSSWSLFISRPFYYQLHPAMMLSQWYGMWKMLLKWPLWEK